MILSLRLVIFGQEKTTMLNSKHLFLLVPLLISFCLNIPAQDYVEIDSLEKVIADFPDTTKARTLNDFGSQKFKKEKYANALPYFKKALNYYVEAEKKEKEIECYNNIGNCYLFLGEYDEAMDYCFKALRLSEKIKDKENIAKSLNNIGNTYLHIGNYQEALDSYFLKSLEILKEIGNKKDISKSLNNIGVAYGNKGEYKKALDFFEKTLAIRKELGVKVDISSAINNIGYVYLQTGKEELAMKNFREAFSISKEIDDKWGVVLGLLNMGQLFYDKGDYKTALPHAKQCLIEAQKLQAKSLISQACKLLSDVYTGMEDYKKSLSYYKLFCEVNDSLFNEKSSNHITDIKVIYETKKKEAEIEILNAENELKDLKLEETKKWNIALIIGILVILLFSIIFFFQKVNLKRASKILVQKNLEIIESEKQNPPNNFTPSSKNQAKYTGSTMSSEQEEDIFNLISDAFENQKVYLQQDLTVTSLADKLNTNKTYISQVINERFYQNFSSFVNDYRIKEARRLLSEEENWNLTIEAIANNVGFKSKSAFNTAFKKFTGITPSYFLDSIKAGK